VALPGPAAARAPTIILPAARGFSAKRMWPCAMADVSAGGAAVSVFSSALGNRQPSP
jgi:hypothetical protein